MLGALGLGERCRYGEEHHVARRDVGLRNLVAVDVAVGHLEALVGQRRAAPLGEVEAHDVMLGHLGSCRNAACALQLLAVALPVVEGERAHLVTVILGHVEGYA